MYLGLRRLVTPMALFMEYITLGRVQDKATIISLMILSTGSLVAAAFDAEFAPVGYAFTLLANSLTVLYTMYMKHLSHNKGEMSVSVLDMMYYNGLLGLPFMLVGG